MPAETPPSGVAEVSAQYHFDGDAVIEPIEIEFYIFAVSNSFNDDLSLLAMWPKQKAPTDEDSIVQNGE
jgi:hypothetical protein